MAATQNRKNPVKYLFLQIKNGDGPNFICDDILLGNRIVHFHAAKMNHIFVSNTRWRNHSSRVLSLYMIHFFITCKMDIPYSEQYRKLTFSLLHKISNVISKSNQED